MRSYCCTKFKFGKFYKCPKFKKIWYSLAGGGEQAHSGQHYIIFKYHNSHYHSIGHIDLNGVLIDRPIAKCPPIHKDEFKTIQVKKLKEPSK